MSETAAGRRSHLIIWAVAEARRLRRQPPPLEDAPARRGTTPPADSQLKRRVIADVRGPVVDWQLSLEGGAELST